MATIPKGPSALDIIRLIGTEFADVDDDTVMKYIAIVRPMVSKKQFGKLYEQAIATLVCHYMKLYGLGAEDPLSDLGGIGAGLTLGSVSEGGSSISFGTNSSSATADDAEYGLTIYGIRFLTLRRQCIVPIHVSGEKEIYGCY